MITDDLPSRPECPDGGTCHHGCVDNAHCFRVEHCGPLSGTYPDNQWPEAPPFIVFRGTGTKAFEGQWIDVPDWWTAIPIPPGSSNTPTYTMVPTGAYEQREDGAVAEVYRPEQGLVELRVLINTSGRVDGVETEVCRALDLCFPDGMTIARNDGAVINFDPVIHDGHAPEGYVPRYHQPAPAYWEEDDTLSLPPDV